MKWFVPVVAAALTFAMPISLHAEANKGGSAPKQGVESQGGTKSQFNPKEITVDKKVPGQQTK